MRTHHTQPPHRTLQNRFQQKTRKNGGTKNWVRNQWKSPCATIFLKLFFEKIVCFKSKTTHPEMCQIPLGSVCDILFESEPHAASGYWILLNIVPFSSVLLGGTV